MKIVEVKIDPESVKQGLQTGEPTVRFSHDGKGCPCGCSPGNWLFISNGKIALRVELSVSETNKLRNGVARVEELV